jgi:hypothetical protein
LGAIVILLVEQNKFADIAWPLSTDDPSNGCSAFASIYADSLISLLVGSKNGTMFATK